MPLPAAAHLVEFTLASPPVRERRPASVGASNDREKQAGAEHDSIEAAFARGHEEGLTAGRAEWASKLDEERAAATARLEEERAAWSSEEGARLGDAIVTAFQTLETQVGDAVAAILTPILEEELRKRAVEDLTQTLARLMASNQRILKLSGPEDLLETLHQSLGAEASAIAFETSQDIDVRVVAEQTTIETQLSAWMRRINGHGA